jgi:demethylmenaquinone methyltransferase/2-methoxy-6-polyprenyl-1,4-benzoquinol methylase
MKSGNEHHNSKLKTQHSKLEISMSSHADYSNRPLNKVFTDVPRRYDLINRMFSWRLDERWRKKAAHECLANDPERFMDLCTGTGDLAIRLANRTNGEMEIIGYDYSKPMLELARVKAEQSGVKNIAFIFGDAASMPFPDGHFDTVGIAFAFRNLTYKNFDTPKFLAEINRVLKPGGRFVIVESSQPKWRWLKGLFRFYTRYFVYPLGSRISGNRPAYKYLSNSVINYYSPDEVCELLNKYGFSEVTYEQLTGGIAAVHVAIKDH